MAARDFWVGVPKKFIQCKCGAKAVVHGYCQKHWELEGKQKYLKKFIEEAKKMTDQKKKYDALLEEAHADGNYNKVKNFCRFELRF